MSDPNAPTIRERSVLDEFQWSPQPQAEAWVRDVVDDFLARNTYAATFARRLAAEAGVRFHDCIGHVSFTRDDGRVAAAIEAGWRHDRTEDGGVAVYVNDHGIFPPIAVGCCDEVAMKVESVADFLAINGLTRAVDGEPLSDVRVCTVSDEGGWQFAVIERHGDASFKAPGKAPAHALARLKHLEAFRTRPRDVPDAEGFAAAERLVDAAIADLGVGLTCDLFFAAEREYWRRRHRAAQVQ